MEKPNITFDCGPCGDNSYPCEDIVIFYQPASCEWQLFTACLLGSGSELLTAPAYKKIDESQQPCLACDTKKCCIYQKQPNMGSASVPSCL